LFDDTGLIDWLADAQAGDDAAFNSLHTELAPSVRRFVGRLIGMENADDVVQDVFLILYKNLESIHPPSKLRPYVFRVARHRCYDWLRKHGRYQMVEWDDEPVNVRMSFQANTMETPHDDTAHWLLLSLEVREAIDALPDAQRQTLILYCEEELTYAEIADVMDVNIGTVKSRLHHAKKALRRLLNPQTLLAIEDSMNE
jgi:RNA polymerase sigma-70 factor (ECF subfamily)